MPSCLVFKNRLNLMDFTSVEFYTLAFVVAMALIALLMGRTEKGTPSTHIVQLGTVPDDGATDDVLTMQAMGNGRVAISRTGIMLLPEETVNLVFTMRGSECTILEKKGVKRRGTPGVPVSGHVMVKCMRPIKYRIRYESQLTSAWAMFDFDAASSQPVEVRLKY